MSLVITAVLVLVALLGLPLFAVLGAGGLAAAWRTGLDPAVLVIELNRLASSPNLAAIPLFTLAGVTLAAGGAPRRLLELFNALVGWLPGGLAGVAIFACAFFTAFTGASGVTILALGGLLFPMLCRSGYPERFSLGLLTSSGSLGLLFPPSLAILMYGIVAGVSIDELFLAGLLPGALLMLMLLAYTMLSGAHRHIPHEPFSLPRLVTALRQGIWDLALPVGLVAGIVSGIVTVTEAAACTAAYVILIECVIHRKLGLVRDMPRVLRETAVLVGSILIILGAAMGLTNQLIDAQVPMRLLDWMGDHVHSQIGFLLLVNVLLLVVGAMMDIFSAIVVVVPLILPLAEQFGVDPVHLGIVLLANLEIGYSTPPVGINLFIASHRFRRPVLTLFRATLPFLAVMIAWLLIITWFPQISLWWRE